LQSQTRPRPKKRLLISRLGVVHRRLKQEMGLKLYATHGTAEALTTGGIECTELAKRPENGAMTVMGRHRAGADRLGDNIPIEYDELGRPDGYHIRRRNRLSSHEMKIAPRLSWIAIGGSGRSTTVSMVVSRVGGSNPRVRSLSTSRWILKAGVWFRRGHLLIVSPDSRGTACPLSGRNSTYRPVQILETGSLHYCLWAFVFAERIPKASSGWAWHHGQNTSNRVSLPRCQLRYCVTLSTWSSNLA
jgi:hypothetical protein